MEVLDNSSMLHQGDDRERIQSKRGNSFKSRAKLTEMVQHLQAVDMRCNGVQKRLDYYKMLYNNAGPGARLKTTLDDQTSSVKPLNPVDNEDYLRKTDNETNRDASESIKQVENEKLSVITGEKSPFTAKSYRIKPIDYLPVNDETQMRNFRQQEDQIKKICRKGVPVPLEESSSISSEDSDHPEEISEPKEIFRPCSPTAKTTKKSELILKIHSARAGSSNRSKVKKADKSGKVSARLGSAANGKAEGNKVDDKLGRLTKIKRQKPKLRKTNSKSITTNKHTSVVLESKSPKKIKRQVNRVKDSPRLELNHKEIPDKIDQNWNEFVEIYHNDAAKNTSVSAVSSKQHFKLEIQKTDDPRAEHEYQKLTRQAENLNKKIADVKLPLEEQIHVDKQNIHELGDQEASFRQKEEETAEPCLHHRHEDCQSAPVRSWCCESFAMRSYLQPTIASKLKSANRCYYPTRLNLRNMRTIPFIVGTSVKSSHNLGLNIQEVLSLMKHRQPGIKPDLRSVLAHKIDEDLDPMLPLSEEVKGDHKSERQIDVETKMSNFPNSQETNTTQSSLLLKQREEELKMNDDKFPRYQGVSNNSNSIRNVCNRLHDELEAMEDKYEKLKEKAEKSNDESLKKEMTALESELAAKEEEIKAMIDLYTEVMALKQHIRMLYEGRSHLYHFQSLHSQRAKTSCSTRAPTTNTRLVGLLRQIQSFRHQLTAS